MWIADVFGRERAESIDLDDIPQLFHRSRQMDVLERPDNHIMLGAKGSGKSTALRALTYRAWKQRAPDQHLPFAGVYIPMGFDAVNPFRIAFDEEGPTESFEHFFASTFLYRLLEQFTDPLPTTFPWAALLDPHLSDVAKQRGSDPLSLANVALSDLSTVRRAVHVDPRSSLSGLTLLLRPLSISTLNELSERYSLLSTRCGIALPPKLALLVDSFDYYGHMGSTLAPLLQSDSGAPLITKIAARTLNVRDIFDAAPTRPIELGRDYHVVSLDRTIDDAEHRVLVADTICRRVRAFGPESIKVLADGDILSTLFHGSESDDEDLASLSSFCRLSSGNVLTVILLIDRAAELQRTAPGPKPTDCQPLRREFRLRAVNELSAHFWNYELGVRLPPQKLDARVFCETALAFAKEALPQDDGSPRFTLPDLAPDRSLVVNMLATRILTAADETVNLRAQSEFVVESPLEFQLNRMLLPKHNRLPQSSGSLILDRSKFLAMYKKALKAAKPFITPVTPHAQRDLFRNDFRVFISMPSDPTKKARTSVLRKAINRLYKETTGQEGGDGISFVDIHCLPHVGPFRSEIPGYIRDATYVVADITDVGQSPERAPGVFYEIGVAIGERKPTALFYNGKRSTEEPLKFRVSMLPPVLRGESVLIWGESGPSFYDEFRRVHEKLAAYNGVWTVPELPQAETPRDGQPYAYLSFQSRNAPAAEWFATLVRRLYPELGIVRSRPWRQDDIGILIASVQKAVLCIIDCTQRINEQALELGLAATTGTRRVLEVWDSERERNVNPVAMFAGHKWSWSDLGGDDERQALKVLQDIGRATMLGGRRP